MNILITGAASGIGAALAELHAERGDRLTLLDRNPALPGQWHGRDGVTTHVGDVLDAGIVREALQATTGLMQRVYANAGIVSMGLLTEVSLDELRRTFDVNVLGALQTAQATLPSLRQSRGTLVVIGSASGHVAYGGLGIYTASKHAVRCLSRQLQHEEGPLGVRVVHVAPGAVDTNIWTRYRPAQSLSAREAARIIVDRVDRSRHEVIFPWTTRMEVWFGRHLPRVHARWVRNRILR